MISGLLFVFVKSAFHLAAEMFRLPVHLSRHIIGIVKVFAAEVAFTVVTFQYLSPRRGPYLRLQEALGAGAPDHDQPATPVAVRKASMSRISACAMSSLLPPRLMYVPSSA